MSGGIALGLMFSVEDTLLVRNSTLRIGADSRTVEMTGTCPPALDCLELASLLPTSPGLHSIGTLREAAT